MGYTRIRPSKTPGKFDFRWILNIDAQTVSDQIVKFWSDHILKIRSGSEQGARIRNPLFNSLPFTENRKTPLLPNLGQDSNPTRKRTGYPNLVPIFFTQEIRIISLKINFATFVSILIYTSYQQSINRSNLYITPTLRIILLDGSSARETEE